MAQRQSGYERRPLEFYETRERWVVEALGEHLRLKGMSVWEPAAGSGLLARHLEALGATVWESDVEASAEPRQRSRESGVDFTTAKWCPPVDAIVTNPPFGGQGRLAVAFIEAGLRWLRAPGGPRFLALLLAADFDSAGGRTALFRDCPEFAGRVVLLRRIRWFDGPSGPSTNHMWAIWQRCEFGPPREPLVLFAPGVTAAETPREVALALEGL